MSRRRTITKSTPKTPRSSRSATLDDQPPSAKLRDSQMDSATGSCRTTPRPESGRPQLSPDALIHTPPFSPADSRNSPRLVPSASGALPPKSLPTPPPHQTGFLPSLKIPPSNLQIRPISHILHMPNEGTGMPAPLSPKRLPSTHITSPRSNHLDQDSFARDTLDRTSTFLEKEHNADNDEDRLRLFSD